MRSKAPLALIEQAVMLAVFALACVLCLRAFVWADLRSEGSAARDEGLLVVQNAAELIKSCRGDFFAAAERYGGRWDGETWTVRYDEHWTATEENAVFVLRAWPEESGVPYLGRGTAALYRDTVCLAQLEVCWQEVSGNGA